MVESLNLNSLTVDDSGRAFFSGLSSGIDFKQAVDSIIAAKRIPVDTLENRVSENESKISALKELRSLLTGLKTSVSQLRGTVTVDNAGNIFEAKQTFASTSRSDGQSPSAAANLLGASVTNAAAAGSHTMEVRRIATAHKVGSGTFADQSSALGFSGQFDLTGSGGTSTIAIQSTDSLQDIRDRINNANTGTSATGVSASIVQVSANEFVLVLTNDKTGADIGFANETNGVLNSLGISSDGGTTLSNELQKAQTARFTADGLTDADRFESDFINDSSAQLGSIASGATFPGSFQLTVGGESVTVNYNSADTVNDLVNNINSAITAAGAGNAVFDAGTNASLMTDGDGVRVVITNSSGAAISTTDTNGLLSELGVDNKLVFERATNTVNDLFTGVTLTLFQAEEGTTIKLDVERDLAQVKSGIQGFVDAYNSVKTFINEQTLIDPATGQKSEEAGPLFSSNTLSNVESQLGQILGQNVDGVNDAFQVLGQIGVNFVDNSSLSDPTLADTLEVDETKLDEALLNNPQDVRRLFGFDFSSSDPQVVLLDYTGKTSFNASGYTLNVNVDNRYQGDQTTTQTTFTQVNAETGGPASDGISSISFDNSVPSTVTSGHAFRYSYNGTTEDLTVENLTAGTSQTVNITAALDAAAGSAGADLGAGESATISFSNLGVTLTLTGDGGTPFTRGTDISDGTLDTSGLDANTTMTNGAVATPASGLDKATVDALIAAGAYDQASGLLTLGVTSNAAGEVHFDTAAGIKFSVDGGPVSADISATDLDDGGAHSIGLYVNDGSSDVQVGTLNFDSLASTAGGSGNLTVDLGTGLFAETSTKISTTAPMSNYLSVTDGSFEIRDSGNTLLGTVNYLAADSIENLATKISAISGVTATVNESGGEFQLEITHDTNDALSFTNDTGSVVSELNLSDRGSGLFAANVDGPANGTDDGTATVSGKTLTVTDQSGAEGLKVLYNGTGDASGIQLDYTVGLGAKLFFSLDNLLDDATGAVETDISTLEDQNEVHEERIEDMLARLEVRRQTLTEQFVRMETALAQAARLRQTIEETFSALSQNDN